MRDGIHDDDDEDEDDDDDDDDDDCNNNVNTNTNDDGENRVSEGGNLERAARVFCGAVAAFCSTSSLLPFVLLP